MRRAVLLPALVLSALLLLAACGGEPTPVAPPVPTIRVLLTGARERESVRVAFPDGWREVDPGSGEVVASGDSLTRIVGLRGAELAAPIRLETDGAFSVDDRRYRGALLLLPDDGGVLPVVETDLESYVPGVLAKEMPRAFPPAARRAQAVAARTYALYKKGVRPAGREWDVTDDTNDQVFVGLVGPIDAALVRSAADTRGLVLTFAGAILPARYSSTCGGHTVPASEGLGAEDLPPLVGMPCRWCTESRKYRWRRELPLADVVAALRLPGPPTGVEIERSARTGRALTLRFLGERPVERAAADVRNRLEPDKMLSVLLEAVEVRGDTVELRGRGWGHGVGMCQMGARGMARAGASPGDILAHYYPGALLSRIY